MKICLFFDPLLSTKIKEETFSFISETEFIILPEIVPLSNILLNVIQSNVGVV